MLVVALAQHWVHARNIVFEASGDNQVQKAGIRIASRGHKFHNSDIGATSQHVRESCSMRCNDNLCIGKDAPLLQTQLR
eukprot:10335832-Ditylum_brightwellii.AAC.1